MINMESLTSDCFCPFSTTIAKQQHPIPLKKRDCCHRLGTLDLSS